MHRAAGFSRVRQTFKIVPHSFRVADRSDTYVLLGVILQGLRSFSLRPAQAERSVLDTFKSVVFPPVTPSVPAVPSFPSDLLLPSPLTKMSTLTNGVRVVTEVWLQTRRKFFSPVFHPLFFKMCSGQCW
jgi:hypothetical protein